MIWTTEPFEATYNSIETGVLDLTFFTKILPDLKALNLTDNKAKNANSRAQLEKGEIEVSSGTYKINQEFIIAVITLSDELNLDELVTAEIMLQATTAAQHDAESDISLINNAKVAFYLRRQYILQIVSYIINCCSTNDKAYIELINDGTLMNNVLLSFTAIHQELQEIKQLVNKAQIIDTYDAFFQQNIKFRRDFLVKEYDILSQILYGLVKSGSLMKRNLINNLINHTSGLESNDFFIIYYLPALFLSFSQLSSLPDSDVKDMHKEFVQELNNESLYKTPVKVTLIFTFLVYFIGWCKAAPATRAKVFDFATTVDIPMTLAVELGAIEQLMVFAADTSEIEKDSSVELFYDIRSLLERHIPRLIPRQLIEGENTLSTFPRDRAHFSHISLSEETLSMFLSAFDQLLQTFITDCAFLLTKTKDAEEDSLLSGEDLGLDEISAKADLERFFLIIYFFYASRPDHSINFWKDKESNAYGFIEWAIKCTDTLMRSCVFLMISSLSYGSENSLIVYQYVNSNHNLHWNHIAQVISEYIIKISSLENRLQEKQQTAQDDTDPTTVALNEGLNEEAIIFLSSLFTLIGSVAYDLDEEMKSKLSNLFSSILFEFLKVDTPLVGAAMKVLSNLVPKEESSRSTFWESLDAWIFKGRPLYATENSYRSAFEASLRSFSDITGFLQLVNSLLKINSKGESGYLMFGKQTFPIKLGRSYRKAGIWPYFDYIFMDVFVHTRQLTDLEERIAIQLPVLEIIENSIHSFDYTVILNSIPAGANLDTLVVTEDFFAYVQESAATAVMNYTFNESIFKSLFNIASIGIDELGSSLESSNVLNHIVGLSVKIINALLICQETYVEELYPIVKKHGKPEYFVPKSFGIHGLRSFYDAILFDLPLIAHFGLYVGLEDYVTASNSLSILKKLSDELSAADSQSIVKDKLLTIFDSVDESARIKEAFMSQLESPIISESSLTLKFEILDFISSNLSLTNRNPTVAHFLLGFQTGTALSLGSSLSTFIESGVSVLSSLLYLLESSLTSLLPENIEYAPIRMASTSLEILLKLCRNPATSSLVLEYLQRAELFEKLMHLDPKLDVHTAWSGKIFNGNFDDISTEFTGTSSIGALLSFLTYRSNVLQYLSLDIHRLHSSSQTSKIFPFVNILTSHILQSPRIFFFLDTLGYNAKPLTNEAFKNIILFGQMDLNLEKIKTTNTCTGNIYDFSELDGLLQLKTRSYEKFLPLLKQDVEIRDKKSLLHFSKEESRRLKGYISNYLTYEKFTSSQFAVLHSWVQLVQIVVLDGEMDSVTRSNFILELFEAIIPKINDYVEFDVCYSEELVSLCVFLYDLYRKDREEIDGERNVDGRLHSLFKACIHGITSPLSTLSLRSDFYVLANCYLTRVLREESLSRQILQSLKMTSERLVEVICNDAISGEGSTRITGILLLDSLTQIASLNKVNFILDSLTKSNMLLLISHSIKTTDELLTSPMESINLEALLYELTAFKSTAHFLIRIAETRSGAQALVQNEIFQTIESCKFLRVDPDLGLELIFGEMASKNSQYVKANLSLDNPLNLSEEANGISLFEVLVPIFQLVASILLSMGSANKPVIKRARKLLVHFRKLVLGVIKRDALIEENGDYQIGPGTLEGLKQLVKLVVLLCTLTGYKGEDSI
ncbi:LAFE_0A04874g1_1 [Lachancea fermentati]|uniref:LAFE_0A04874g1_1 n=1 Tax=Lachancea fermentati TaxID=4955 RepID=A0A1G4M6P8_LACFM|nr:LAFE_0A04874g1_1 [Lachancea fermentati]